MTDSRAGNGFRLTQALRRRLPRRRDDSGLTTLEWLLIVAAVAGLAALAVVLVQNVVGDTTEQIAGQTARRTAATLSAQDIGTDAQVAINAARTPAPANQAAATTEYNTLYNEYLQKCNRIPILYSDIEPNDGANRLNVTFTPQPAILVGTPWIPSTALVCAITN